MPFYRSRAGRLIPRTLGESYAVYGRWHTRHTVQAFYRLYLDSSIWEAIELFEELQDEVELPIDDTNSGELATFIRDRYRGE